MLSRIFNAVYYVVFAVLLACAAAGAVTMTKYLFWTNTEVSTYQENAQ